MCIRDSLGIVEFADQGDVVAGHSLHDVGEKTGVFFQQNLEGSLIQTVEDTVCLCAVSYTHLDVYKRQSLHHG